MDDIKKLTDGSGALTGFRSLLSDNFFTVKILLLGLAIAQIIATIHVYLSNSSLFHSLENLKNAGYLIVPNHNVMQGLMGFGPAFYGGLFFTLSVGALLSLLGLVSAFIWARLLKHKKAILLPFLILWAGLICEININGFCPVISLYFLFIPSIVFFTASKYISSSTLNLKTSFRPLMIRIIPVLLIAVLWILQIDTGIFTNVRDHLLLSNSPGTKINDFYYRYTMYPAEAIKSLDQKIIKTYRLDKISDNNLSYRIRKRLINYDFLELNENATVDLSIEEYNNSLNMKNDRKTILTMRTGDFLSDTENSLREFSSQIDRLDFFRHFTFISLLTGFPAVIIILFYSILGSILNLFFNYRHASTVSLFLCLIAAVSLSAFFYHVSGKKVETEDLRAALNSGRWHDRVLALKMIDKDKMDISSYGNYQAILSSPHIPVRYWLAKVLGKSNDPASYEDLLILMDDPSPNVACMAYFSTGQRGDKKNIEELLKRIKLSDHWYEQWYAYKALRALGWKQKK